MGSIKQYFFASEQLGFRVMNEKDIETMYRISSDPEVMRYFPKLYEPSDAEKLVSRMITCQEKYGYSFYATDYLDEEKCIGFIGLSWFDYPIGIAPFTEIGWRLDKKYWNRGLATKGAKACLEFAHETLSLTEIYSLAVKNNKPSERVMQKIGMKFHSEFLHPAIDSESPLNPHVLYKIDL